MKDDTQLARWLAGEMDAREIAAFQKTKEYALYARINANFAKLESPNFNSERILQDVLRHEKTPVKTIPIYRKTVFRVAAAIAVLLGMAIAFQMMPVRETAAYGNTLAFALPDASEVILNAGSEAGYSKWNWSNNREISLDGEAYFKVAKGQRFTVKTALGMVNVLGTQFNVRARGSRFEVVCYEGKVQVQFGNTETILTPNQKIAFNEGIPSGMMPVQTNEPGWLHNELVFSKETLAEVIGEIERQYDVTIHTNVLSVQLFSGSVPGNDLDAALGILSATYHLKVDKSANNITLTNINGNP